MSGWFWHGERHFDGDGKAMWGWLLETAGAPQLAIRNPEDFKRYMAELRVPARERRQLPYAGWVVGRSVMQAGIVLPGMRAAGAVLSNLYGQLPLGLFGELQGIADSRQREGLQDEVMRAVQASAGATQGRES